MMSALATNLKDVLLRIDSAYSKVLQHKSLMKPRLIAVSKTKPVEDILEVYNAGQRFFGENYIQELEEKAQSPIILEKCPEIQWHFIGRLQTNKVKKLLEVPNLSMIETVSSIKLANEINKHAQNRATSNFLKIMIQVNTSQEEQKGGCSMTEVSPLAQHIFKDCPNIRLAGLMTIGSFDHDMSTGPNPDFLALLNCRRDVCQTLSLEETALEISMGMSDDFEHAIELGSTNVRVGRTIFGSRNYPA